MALKVVNTGEVAALGCYLNKVAQEDMRLVLFQNDPVLTDTLEVSDFTDASFPGYAPVVMLGQSWVVNPGNPSQAEYPAVIFACTENTPAQTIFGYYVMRNLTLDLQWAEKFPTTQTVTTLGQEITVVPRLTAKDETD